MGADRVLDGGAASAGGLRRIEDVLSSDELGAMGLQLHGDDWNRR